MPGHDIASRFLLDEPKYKDIVQGWNSKLNSSSLKLSGLTPFVELYAVFKEGQDVNDIVFDTSRTTFKETSNRLYDVTLRQAGSENKLRAKVAPIATANKTQLEPDSLNKYGSSYRGAAGINDLAVSRGAAASLNVKYDLQITLPNPELINELYEYSRIMTLNSSFLIIYGWNTSDFENVVPPPNILNNNTEITLNQRGAGFYESSLVSLYRFDFSFDNVGHLTGKLSFLPEHGNFLVATRADTIAVPVLKRLTSYVRPDTPLTAAAPPAPGQEGVLGFEEIDINSAVPWEISSLGSNFTSDKLIDTMPKYGNQLQKEILEHFKDIKNPNNKIFYENGIISNKFDEETSTLWRRSSCVSTMLFDISDPTQEQAEGIEIDAQIEGGTTKVKISLQAQPVYYFLGSVLESIRMATSNKVKFYYQDFSDISKNYSFPIPSNTKAQFQQEVDTLNSQIELKKSEIESLKDEKTKVNNDTELSDESKMDRKKEIDDEIEVAEGVIKFAQGQIYAIGRISPTLGQTYSTLECRNVFELPVNISAINQIIEQEGSAPLHNVIKKIIDVASTTNPSIKLGTRNYTGAPDYIEVYVANLEVEGVSKEIFDSIDLTQITNLTNGSTDSNTILNFFSDKVVVCEFATERSLVENFSLNSKVDPLAFAAFRLPSIVGGKEVDVAGLVKDNLGNTGSGFLKDITSILEKDLFSSKQSLVDLNIVTVDDNGKVKSVNTDNLSNFLNSQNTTQGKQVVTNFIDELRAVNATFNNNIIAKQNEKIVGSNNSTGSRPSFYGGILSSFLRSITLTIHGTVGLTMFNLIYIRGIMRGIEGVYMITSVTESLTPSNFTTTLECKLINYKNSNSKTNPFAEQKFTTLGSLAEQAKKDGASNFEKLFEDTEEALEKARDSTQVNWG